jgi:hypothetical protein
MVTQKMVAAKEYQNKVAKSLYFFKVKNYNPLACMEAYILESQNFPFDSST